ncbi:MAG: NAD(P)-binding protein, partial [Lachnospiraceae bacterium]|nr:NAD(P)-binding protein [Lachnospiraceae bacterium]
MIRISQLKIPCGQGEKALEGKILRSLGLKDQGRILSRQIEKHSLDARKKPDLYDIYTVSVKTKGGRKAEETLVRRLHDKNVTFFTPSPYSFPAGGDRKLSERPVIIGAGPAGIFCALLLAEHGYRPLLIERG